MFGEDCMTEFPANASRAARASRQNEQFWGKYLTSNFSLTFTQNRLEKTKKDGLTRLLGLSVNWR